MIELLISLSLMILMLYVAMTVTMQNPKNSWGRVADDYVKHLMALKERYKKEEGAYPFTPMILLGTRQDHGITDATQVMPILLDETSAEVSSLSTGASFCALTYPEGMRLYGTCATGEGLWTNAVLPASELPVYPGSESPWVLLDMNGAQPPNSLASKGDRVLLYLAPPDQNTGYTERILTRRQFALEYCPSTCTGHEKDVSFYDQYKGYDALGDNSGTSSTSSSSGSTSGSTTGL